MKKKNSQNFRSHPIRRLLQLAIVAAICCIAGMTLYQQFRALLRSQHDKLAYTVHDGSMTTLMLYDSATGEKRTLIENFSGGHFNFSSDGQIVYQDWDINDTRQIYVLDTTTENSEPVNITAQLADDAFIVYAWSLNSQYLAYQADQLLYLWDGQQSIDITPNTIKEQRDLYEYYDYKVRWSPDGRMAFQVWMLPDDETEIFLWDGDQTVNLSPSPSGYNGIPAWSPDGQLAFDSVRNGRPGIWIWDGVSYVAGVPDTTSFTFIETDSDTLLWTYDNRLIVDSVDQMRRVEYHVQLWDGEMVNNIIQLPDAMNYGIQWNPDGRLAFISSDMGSDVIVRDEHNKDIARFTGQMAVSWSNDGQLAYAGYGRSLMVWNGDEHIQLAESTWETFATWQSGENMHFSFWIH